MTYSIIDHEYSSATDTLNLAFMSDLHCDSPGFDEKAFDRDVKKILAMDPKPLVFIGGDVAELILPGDKRYSRSSITGTENDSLFVWAADVAAKRLEPLAPHIVWMGWGNHEDSALKYNHVAFTGMVISRLAQMGAGDIQFGTYKSTIRIRQRSKKDGGAAPVDILHYHGKGSNAPVSKGMIDFARLKADYQGFHIIWTGHKHAEIADKDHYVTVGQNGRPRREPRVCFQTAGYQGSEGYERGDPDRVDVRFSDRFASETAVGCVRVSCNMVRWRGGDGTRGSTIEMDVTL